MNIAPGMKLLFIDIETSPTVAYVWGLHNENIGVEQIITPGGLLCFSAKWHGVQPDVFRSRWKNGQRAMVLKAHELLSAADAVGHYNGMSFDLPILNDEFIRLGLPPPPPIPQIDLLRVVHRKLRSSSAKLAFIGPHLKVGEKKQHEGFPLWSGCLNGDRDCQRRMEEYCTQDTQLLEPLYEKLLPWIDSHPNRAMYMLDGTRRPLCPACGKDKLRSDGLRRATTYTYRRYRCLNCGAWSRQRVATAIMGPPPGVRGF